MKRGRILSTVSAGDVMGLYDACVDTESEHDEDNDDEVLDVKEKQHLKIVLILENGCTH